MCKWGEQALALDAPEGVRQVQVLVASVELLLVECTPLERASARAAMPWSPWEVSHRLQCSG